MQTIGDKLGPAPVEVVVELATTTITTADLLDLRVGDIIASEKDVNDPLLVSVEGKPKFHAAPGQYKGRKAIRILENYQPTRLNVDDEAAARATAAK